MNKLLVFPSRNMQRKEKLDKRCWALSVLSNVIFIYVFINVTTNWLWFPADWLSCSSAFIQSSVQVLFLSLETFLKAPSMQVFDVPVGFKAETQVPDALFVVLPPPNLTGVEPLRLVSCCFLLPLIFHGLLLPYFSESRCTHSTSSSSLADNRSLAEKTGWKVALCRYYIVNRITSSTRQSSLSWRSRAVDSTRVFTVAGSGFDKNDQYQEMASMSIALISACNEKIKCSRVSLLLLFGRCPPDEPWQRAASQTGGAAVKTPTSRSESSLIIGFNSHLRNSFWANQSGGASGDER